MLQISIPDKPNFRSIPSNAEKLISNGIKISKIISTIEINKLNVDQFCFLMGLAAFEGKNFESNFELVKKFILNRNRNDLELLVIENNLHSLFLKKYETDFVYNKFYNFIS